MSKEQKILQVDNEQDILEFLSYNFSKNIFDVFKANNWLERIIKAELELPHLIISAILMPEMDGIEMCKTIRKIPNLKQVPFLFLSAVSDDYKVLHARLSGADQFVSKPIKFEYLLKIVNELLEGEEINMQTKKIKCNAIN